MKKTLLALLTVLSASASAQHSLSEIWQSYTTLKTPESVLVDARSKTLYVSNIGDIKTPNTGFVSKLDMNGNIKALEWVKGLNAIKGLGLYKNMLYAAELNAVAVIDVTKGSIVKRIPIEGSKMLNDITVDAKGIVYVSDTQTGKIHRIANGKVSLYMENQKGVNGLLSVGSSLYILADGTFIKADADKKTTVIATGIEGGADGIVMVKPNEFIVSGWGGVVYYINAKGAKEVLLDTRQKKRSTADIGYDANTRTLYIPTFFGNAVDAYKLK
ncbi:ATP/GTP-binding protein [Mucilaginibacter sp. 21P]|uniref:SMP-30/gluconolactonase/LRE family protein n=1 Tax=Mucilaginibacter sp. 21P TaxID=2778902 RepID=UPI001C597DF1|nr:ATP-binding protein [Mucilaginibacter sp. 21P]QXV64049.1 ATP/GTP-binding protein [Mucilaginibacter sp. 21P]